MFPLYTLYDMSTENWKGLDLICGKYPLLTNYLVFKPRSYLSPFIDVFYNVCLYSMITMVVTCLSNTMSVCSLLTLIVVHLLN